MVEREHERDCEQNGCGEDDPDSQAQRNGAYVISGAVSGDGLGSRTSVVTRARVYAVTGTGIAVPRVLAPLQPDP